MELRDTHSSDPGSHVSAKSRAFAGQKHCQVELLAEVRGRYRQAICTNRKTEKDRWTLLHFSIKYCLHELIPERLAGLTDPAEADKADTTHDLGRPGGKTASSWPMGKMRIASLTLV